MQRRKGIGSKDLNLQIHAYLHTVQAKGTAADKGVSFFLLVSARSLPVAFWQCCIILTLFL